MTEEEIRYLAEKFGVVPDTGFRPGSFETPEAFGTKRDPTAGALSQGMSDAERKRVKKERDEVRSGLSTLDKAKGVLEAGAMLGTAIPSAMIAPFAKEFTGTPEEDFINKYMYVPRTEAGLLYADEGGEGIESGIEAIGESPLGKALGPIVDKIPVYTPLMGAPAHMAGRIGKATKTATDKAQELTQEGQDILRKGSDYETSQEGPFYRVRPASQGSGQAVRGNKEEARTGAPDTGGAVRGDVPQPITDAQVSDVMAQPDNFVRSVASQYAEEVNGQPYELPEMAPSSLLKQAPIGRAFDLAVSEDPQYKKRVFEAYGQAVPEVIEQSGAKNYDQLVEAAYRQLAKETDAQFRRLPVSMSFHRAGEGNYSDSKDMLRDVYGNRHLYVFQGGDPHPFLNQVDPVTGLNDNEKFRAVHDFFGHAIHGNQFGPKGEETAWLAHSQMYSPLARLAMSTETRGQNSVVNYTPLNAQLKRSLSEIEGRIMEARRRNQTDDLKELQAIKRDLFNQFQYAPQQGLLLPPEMIRPDYAGKMPDYLRPLIKPAPGTAQSARLTHFSGEPSMKVTDPSRYGSGIKGAEAERLAGAPDIRPRTYFYTGENPTPETGLGPFRYGAEADLYNLAEDPLSFRALASESLRSPFTSKANPGMVDPMEATTAAERLVKEYGYPGYMNPEFGAATVFQPMEVQRYAKGGAVTMKKGGAASALTGIAAARQASKAARRQERVDKNLQRWSGSEEKPPVYYHGTSAREDFSVFDPEKRPTPKSSSAVFMTPSKEWSSDWIDTNPEILEKFPSSKPRVMPLITRAKNSFDYENPEHVQAVVGRAKLPKAFTPDYVAERIGEGNWNFIEDQNIQKAIKDQGFDSFFVKEKGVKNLGVFNPADVKSLFNRGSYSEDPDISKAKGGVVLKGIAQARAEARMKRGGEVHLAVGGNKPLKGVAAGIKAASEATAKKKAERKHPVVFEPAEPLKKQDIKAMAQSMADQVSGQFVRPDPKKSVNPAGKSRKQFERERELEKTIRTNVAERNIPTVDIEGQEGKLLVAVPGDPTVGGVVRPSSLMEAPKGTRELVSLAGKDLDVPAQLYGGPRYGAESQIPEGVDPAFWASNIGAARGIQNPVTEFSQVMEGAPVLGMYTKMTPESSTYALHTLDSLLGYQEPHRLSKTKREQLNRLVKKGNLKAGKFPGFVGFDDPASVLLQARQNPELRKHISSVLMMPSVTEPMKMRSGLDVLSAISHPEIENLAPGSSGFSMGVMRPGSDLFESAHPTYSHDIPGEFMGQTKYPIPAELAFPRTMSYVRKNIPKGQPFNTMKMVGAREVIDPQYIDQIKLYEEYMKALTGRKKGGLAKNKQLEVNHG